MFKKKFKEESSIEVEAEESIEEEESEEREETTGEEEEADEVTSADQIAAIEGYRDGILKEVDQLEKSKNELTLRKADLSNKLDPDFEDKILAMEEKANHADLHDMPGKAKAIGDEIAKLQHERKATVEEIEKIDAELARMEEQQKSLVLDLVRELQPGIKETRFSMIEEALDWGADQIDFCQDLLDRYGLRDRLPVGFLKSGMKYFDEKPWRVTRDEIADLFGFV